MKKKDLNKSRYFINIMIKTKETNLYFNLSLIRIYTYLIYINKSRFKSKRKSNTKLK